MLNISAKFHSNLYEDVIRAVQLFSLNDPALCFETGYYFRVCTSLAISQRL